MSTEELDQTYSSIIKRPKIPRKFQKIPYLRSTLYYSMVTPRENSRATIALLYNIVRRKISHPLGANFEVFFLHDGEENTKKLRAMCPMENLDLFPKPPILAWVLPLVWRRTALLVIPRGCVILRATWYTSDRS
ncbi:unnamed protein product [Laminaria digitata]